MRKLVVVLLVMALIATMVVGCATTTTAPTAEAAPAAAEPAAEAAPEEAATTPAKVALVVNQRVGDGGVVDDMARGAEEAAAAFGVELQILESESQANHEDDLRAMAEAGYQLIITTFTPMSEATKLVAAEFPDTAFVAVYQFINSGDEKVANVRSLEFRGNEAMFIEGYMAGLISPNKHVGFEIGGEEPGTSAEANGWLQGAASASADMQLEYGVINSFEDPVKAKEIASAMISKGVDVIHVPSCQSGNGIIEACAENKSYADSDVKSYYDVYNGMIGYCGMGFDASVYNSIQQFSEGTLELGVHGYLDLTNGGYYMGWEDYEKFAADHPDMSASVLSAIEKGKAVEERIKSGDLKIMYDPEPSDPARSIANAIAELQQ